MTGFRAADKQHVIKYWKGILEASKDQNPIDDDDGSKHDLSTDLVYFIGNFGGTSNRRLTKPISSKQSIFVPVNPVVISEPEASPETDLEGIAEKDENSASISELEIDNVKHDVGDNKYRVDTERFNVNLPSGPCKAVADGYYVVIDPLPPGKNHKIAFTGKVEEPYKQSRPWHSKVTYTFDVE